jgi:hypothetical protein
MIAFPESRSCCGYLIRRGFCVAARRHSQSKLAMSPQFHDAKTLELTMPPTLLARADF